MLSKSSTAMCSKCQLHSGASNELPLSFPLENNLEVGSKLNVTFTSSPLSLRSLSHHLTEPRAVPPSWTLWQHGGEK